MQFIICLYYFTCVIEYVHCNYFIKRFRGAVSVRAGPVPNYTAW